MLGSSNYSAHEKSGWRPSLSFWISAPVVAVLILLFGLSGGFGGALFLLGIVAIITGLYILLFRRRSWLGLPRKRAFGAIISGLGIMLFIFGGIASPAKQTISVQQAGTATETGAATQHQTATGTSTPTPTPTATSPSLTRCDAAADTTTVGNTTYVCTADEAGLLVWMDQDSSRKILADRKTAADKSAADKAAADQAAQQAAADQAAQQAAADQAAQQAVADQAAQQQAVQNPGVGATALCKDGSLSYSAHHSGTCSHHDGVAVWYK